MLGEIRCCHGSGGNSNNIVRVNLLLWRVSLVPARVPCWGLGVMPMFPVDMSDGNKDIQMVFRVGEQVSHVILAQWDREP